MLYKACVGGYADSHMSLLAVNFERLPEVGIGARVEAGADRNTYAERLLEMQLAQKLEGAAAGMPRKG